jgi:predicted nucleic acid-binding protein
MSGRKLAYDTSLLIAHWHRCLRGRPLADVSMKEVAAWADALIEIHRTEMICTPVRIEFLCNTSGRDDLKKVQAYLARFRLLDEGNVTREDWARAEENAPRRMTDRKSTRQLGDCLIAAIYGRRGYYAVPSATEDADFVRRVNTPKTKRDDR